jgi:hypothetical protein
MTSRIRITELPQEMTELVETLPFPPAVEVTAGVADVLIGDG